MSAGRTPLVIGLLLGACLLVAACSEANRYRVLRVFFDGVPDPDAPPTALDNVQRLPSPAEGKSRPPAVAVYRHAPYRERRCRECHNPDNGLLQITLKEGLCLTCHEDVPGNLSYAHGPVAQGDCVFCHHYHSSPNPAMLHDEPTTLCLRCHDQQRLLEGPAHQGIGEADCTECHNPHGGDDPFFLDRSEP